VRVLDGGAYATLVGGAAGDTPVTFEGEAEKPTRAPAKKKAVEAPTEDVAAELEPEWAELEEAEEPEELEEPGEIEVEAGEEVAVGGTAAAPKRKTRRGTRGGRGRSKRQPAVAEGGEPAGAEPTPEPEPAAARPAAPADGRRPRQPRIHVPAARLGEPEEAPAAEPSGNGDAPALGEELVKPKRKTRRGTRGGRGRKKPAVAGSDGAAAVEAAEAVSEPAPRPARERKPAAARVLAAEPVPEAEPAPQSSPASSDYVPMSEWLDDLER
ncbi:MAG: hypothetical protein HY511_08150, partial [Actinobacteria bacterium]|nr:hypothetical protein [Actinomycetota bacterium]